MIFGEPQPWAILAGAPTRAAGDDARREHPPLPRPASARRGGPAGQIGSSQSPARRRPGRDRAQRGGRGGIGDGNAVYVGGAWYAVNGWLTWALGRSTASSRTRATTPWTSTRATRSRPTRRAYPDHWDGMISVDDACRSCYSTRPGAVRRSGSPPTYDTARSCTSPRGRSSTRSSSPASSPTARGYPIGPRCRCGASRCGCRGVGVKATRGAVRGCSADGERPPALRVAGVPPGGRSVTAWADGRAVAHRISQGARRLLAPHPPRPSGAAWAIHAR